MPLAQPMPSVSARVVIGSIGMRFPGLEARSALPAPWSMGRHRGDLGADRRPNRDKYRPEPARAGPAPENQGVLLPMLLDLAAVPVIETGRLWLRLPRADDLDRFQLMYGDPEVMRYVGSGQTGGREDAWRGIAL